MFNYIILIICLLMLLLFVKLMGFILGLMMWIEGEIGKCRGLLLLRIFLSLFFFIQT